LEIILAKVFSINHAAVELLLLLQLGYHQAVLSRRYQLVLVIGILCH
jgi:hypothetical protein